MEISKTTFQNDVKRAFVVFAFLSASGKLVEVTKKQALKLSEDTTYEVSDYAGKVSVVLF